MTYPNTQLFINGQWQDSPSGKTLAALNPPTCHQTGRDPPARHAAPPPPPNLGNLPPPRHFSRM